MSMNLHHQISINTVLGQSTALLGQNTPLGTLKLEYIKFCILVISLQV